MADSEAPVDRRNLVYVIFVWLGVGTLLPWNFFITQNSYWNLRWHNIDCVAIPAPQAVTGATTAIQESTDVNSGVQENLEDGINGTINCALNGTLNDMQKMWNPRMAIASMLPNVTFLLLNALFGHRFKTQPRLLVSLILVIILFGFTAGMTQVDTDSWQSNFMTLTLVSVVFININAAIFQGGLIGVAGRFPPAYIGGVFSGQAVGGIFASVTSVVMVLLGAAPLNQALFSFLVAVVFLGGSLVFYLIVTRSAFFQYYLGENTEAKDEELAISLNKGDHQITEECKFLDEEKKGTESTNGDGPYPPPVKVVIPHKVNPLLVFQTIWMYGISVLLIFAVTLTCFPALTVLFKSVNKDSYESWGNDYFIPVCCFVLFNVGDYVGRFIAEKLQWPKPGKVGERYTFASITVFVLSLTRLVFIPLFLYANEFHSDTVYIVIMLLFSLSNGYLGNICMMSGPAICHPDEQMTAASLMVALLGIGLASGAAISNAITAMSG